MLLFVTSHKGSRDTPKRQSARCAAARWWTDVCVFAKERERETHTFTLGEEICCEWVQKTQRWLCYPVFLLCMMQADMPLHAKQESDKSLTDLSSTERKNSRRTINISNSALKHLKFFHYIKKKNIIYASCVLPNKNICPSLQTVHISLHLCNSRFAVVSIAT